MARRILDTNRLIGFWRRRRNDRPYSQISESEVAEWAIQLLEQTQSEGIVTPVLIEFLAGTQSSEELRLARSFLAGLQVIDRGEISKDDWLNAQRYAERVPKDGRRRTMPDCLIRAIADRLNFELLTDDTGVPRSGGLSRRQRRN